jgi:tripartite-type tricarboxylate transporter receptor subunit TctC
MGDEDCIGCRCLGCLQSSQFSSVGECVGADGARLHKGKQITRLVSIAAGGGYDTYARTLARHMPKYIPGNAARLQMEIDPLTGAEIEALLARAYGAPKDVIAAAARLVP